MYFQNTGGPMSAPIVFLDVITVMTQDLGISVFQPIVFSVTVFYFDI